MKLGFSNGAFYRIQSHDDDRWDASVHKHFIGQGIEAIELHSRGGVINMEALLKRLPDIELPDSLLVSLHAPILSHRDESELRSLLDGMVRIHKYHTLNNIVVHPDNISQWDVIAEYTPTLPISIENMDKQKTFGRTVADIASILEVYPFGLTLDVQHCYENDPTMSLARDFHTRFNDRIVEYHLSGYDPALLHVALFDRNQDEIIQSIEKSDVPIILESCFDTYADLQKELSYVQERLQA